MKTIAYIGVSDAGKSMASQKSAILDYAKRKRITVDEFAEAPSRSRQPKGRRRMDPVLSGLRKSDTLIVADLSRLGRSLGEIVQIVNALVKRNIHVIAIEDDIRLEGKRDVRTQSVTAVFDRLARLDKAVLSEVIKEGQAAARAKGKRLGRPKGSRGPSKLDGREEEIREYLAKGVSKASIAKILEVSRGGLCHFLRVKGLGSST